MAASSLHRLAIGLTSVNEAEFVALVDLARPLVAEGAPAVLVVPALDGVATARRVRELVGDDPCVVVEPAHEYLRTGHARAVLVGADPATRGHGVAASVAWLRSLRDAGSVMADGASPDPADVVAWLGSDAVPVGRRTDGRGPSPAPAAVAVGEDRLLVRTAWGAKLLAFASDRSLTPDLALDGVYDPSFVRFLERHVGAGAFAVDVGANVGVFSVLLAQLVGPGGQVMALEADPEVHGVLQENLDLNYVSGWSRALAVAAYSSRAQLAFHRRSRFRGNGSLRDHHARHAGVVTDSSSTVVVEAAPLDELVPAGVDVALVKVDVEGAERHVLEGLARTIAEGRVRMVAIEFVRALFGDEWEPLVRLLGDFRESHGATFATVAPDGSPVTRSLEEAVEMGAFPQLLIEFGSSHG